MDMIVIGFIVLLLFVIGFYPSKSHKNKKEQFDTSSGLVSLETNYETRMGAKKYSPWLIVILLVVGTTLPFHYVFFKGDISIFPKEQLSYSNTFISETDIEILVKRFNDASTFEKSAINNEPLIRKLREKGIIIEKSLFDNQK